MKRQVAADKFAALSTFDNKIAHDNPLKSKRRCVFNKDRDNPSGNLDEKMIFSAVNKPHREDISNFLLDSMKLDLNAPRHPHITRHPGDPPTNNIPTIKLGQSDSQKFIPDIPLSPPTPAKAPPKSSHMSQRPSIIKLLYQEILGDSPLLFSQNRDLEIPIEKAGILGLRGIDSNLMGNDSKNPEQKFLNGAHNWTKMALGKFSESVFKKSEGIPGDDTQQTAVRKKIDCESDFRRYLDAGIGAEDGLDFFRGELKKYIEHGDREIYFQQLKFQKIYVLFKNAREEKTRLENIIMHLDRFLSHGSQFIKKNQNQRETIEEPDSNLFGVSSSQDFFKKELIKTTQNFRYSSIGKMKDRVEYTPGKLVESSGGDYGNRKISVDDCSIGKFGPASHRNLKGDVSNRDVFSLFDAKNSSIGFGAKCENLTRERNPMSVKNNNW
jgi:hypothetical protein